MSSLATIPSIAVRKATADDRSKLTKFVRGSAIGTGFQTFEWGLLRQEQGWGFDALLAVRTDSGGREEIAGSAVIIYRRLGPVSMAYAPRGPVLADPHDKQAVSELLTAMAQHAKARGAVTLRVNPDIDSESPAAAVVTECLATLKFGKVGDNIMHTSTMRSSLVAEEEELMANLEKRAQSAVRKGLKEGIQVKSDLDGADITHFYGLLEETRSRQDFSIPDKSHFELVAGRLFPGGIARCFVAYAPDGEPLSGACVMLTESRLLYVWGGSSDRRRNLNASQVMHWEMMLWAKRHGLLEYDFHGVHACNLGEPGWGVYLFKRSFGGELVHLIGEYELSLNAALYPVYRKFREYQSSRQKH